MNDPQVLAGGFRLGVLELDPMIDILLQVIIEEIFSGEKGGGWLREVEQDRGSC